MRILNYKFTPGLWPTLLFVLLLPFFISMGLWQLDRAEQKEDLQQDYLEQKQRPAINLQEMSFDSALEDLAWRKVAITGEFLEGINILLDNKIVHGKAGFYIFKPLKIPGQDKLILINLGWQQSPITRDAVPELAAVASLANELGFIKQAQFSGVKLTETPVEKLSAEIFRVQHIDYEQLNKYFNFELLPFVIRVSKESKLGYNTDWQEPGFGQEKHLGYAFQWFSFAVVLFVLFIILNLRRV